MSKSANSKSEPIVIKKYANRRLYNTDTSTYVTLEDLADMVRSERDFVVYDAKSREDLTRSVLTQIIVEQEAKGENLLPIKFLRQLIRFYGDSMGGFVPSYLEMSIDSLTQQQDKYRSQLADAFAGTPFEAMQEQTRQNMAMFEKAFEMFVPFAAGNLNGEEKGPIPPTNGATKEASASDELASLKEQLSDMQSKLEKLADK